jgi:hypothetical protein
VLEQIIMIVLGLVAGYFAVAHFLVSGQPA